MTVAVRVIPCLDVDAGRVVKGINFEGLRDAGDPVELAHRYDNGGADELTFLDVTASSGNRETTFDVVRRTAEQDQRTAGELHRSGQLGQQDPREGDGRDDLQERDEGRQA